MSNDSKSEKEAVFPIDSCLFFVGEFVMNVW